MYLVKAPTPDTEQKLERQHWVRVRPLYCDCLFACQVDLCTVSCRQLWCNRFFKWALKFIHMIFCNKTRVMLFSQVAIPWRHNDAMASQITSLTIIYLTAYSDADQIKHQRSASLAFVKGIHRWPVNSPHKWPVTRKMFPLMTSSLAWCVWCHRALRLQLNESPQTSCWSRSSVHNRMLPWDANIHMDS